MWGMEGGSATVGVSPLAVGFEAVDVPVHGVMVGTPMYGGMCHLAFLYGMLSLAKSLGERGIPMSYANTGADSLVQRARNNIVAQFMASDCSHLVFIDADIGFTGESVLRLIAHNRPIVAGIYRKKTPGPVDWVVNFIKTDDGLADRDPRTGAIRVRHAPTGFLCIQRHVLQRMYDERPDLHYRPCADEGAPEWRNKLFAAFDCFIDPTDGIYLSEDWGFCRRADEIGFEIWIDPGIVLEHHGGACFIADPMETFR